MEIRGRKALVLGGAGLVGQAICRKFIEEGISEIIISSLFKHESEAFAEQLKTEFGRDCPKLHAEWGNVFVRHSLKDLSRVELLENQGNREIMMGDLLKPLNREILENSSIYHLMNKYKPDIVIDSINTATAISYQNLFGVARQACDILKEASGGAKLSGDQVGTLEKLIITQYLPQLIRHVQIFLSSMNEAKTKCYLKIGTCGTGGMGLNIPYTHSEDKPSQMLLAKSSVAGAHSLLLFLMARTPGGPVIKELKPAAAIAWKRIEVGPVAKAGKQILLEDVSAGDTVSLTGMFKKTPSSAVKYVEENGKPKPLVAPFIDTGENGVFSMGEFAALTDEGQMEFITPEEIATAAMWEINGRNSGFDVVAALDNSTMGPTYRAGYMREQALSELSNLVKESGIDSVAFEILGPPRLSKLLYEAYLLKMAYGTFSAFYKNSAKDISTNLERLVTEDSGLRSRIISIGIPILLSCGTKLLRGSKVVIPADVPGKPDMAFEITKDSVNLWAHDGWVDLRPENMERWKHRFEKIEKDISSHLSTDSSSNTAKTSGRYWTYDSGSVVIEEAKLVSWIFINEESGSRMKA